MPREARLYGPVLSAVTSATNLSISSIHKHRDVSFVNSDEGLSLLFVGAESKTVDNGRSWNLESDY